MIVGIITFRALFQGLDDASFGFYQLLWGVIGYAVLMDFGFGFAVQRNVAQADGANTRRAKRAAGEAVSTVFWTFVGLAFSMGVVLALIGPSLLAALDFGSQAARDEAGPAALVFLIGLMAAFPFGVFREVLRGLNRIHLANICEIVGIIGQGVGICLALHFEASLAVLVAVGVGANLLPLCFMAVMVAVIAPHLIPSLRLFRWQRVRELAGFSLVAYIITMTNVIMGQTDQLLIGGMLGLAAIALYQPGFKLAQMFGQFAIQLHDVLGPLAAKASGQGDESQKREHLAALFCGGQRWGTMIALLLGIPMLALTEPLLRLLTGVETVDVVMLVVAQALILGLMLSLIGSGTGQAHFNDVRPPYFRPWRQRRRGSDQSRRQHSCHLVAEFPIGAAVGTLVAHVIIPIPLVLTFSAKRLKISQRRAWAETARGLLALSPAAMVALVAANLLPPAPSLSTLALACSIIGFSAVLGIACIGTSSQERQTLLGFWRKMKSKLRPSIEPLHKCRSTVRAG